MTLALREVRIAVPDGQRSRTLLDGVDLDVGAGRRDLRDERGELLYRFGVILNYLFNITSLTEIAHKKLPVHVVEKKIPHIDRDGNTVKPSSPNGFKFETLILDMIHMMDSCLAYEIVREREFAPIKNPTGVDSVESARELLKKNGVEL